MDTNSVKSLENSVKSWWKTTAMDATVIKDISDKKIIIDGYTLFTPSGHIACVSAKKEGNVTELFNCGYINTPKEFLDCLNTKLNPKLDGGKRKTRRNRKSKKSRKNRRKSNRRRR